MDNKLPEYEAREVPLSEFQKKFEIGKYYSARKIRKNILDCFTKEEREDVLFPGLDRICIGNELYEAPDSIRDKLKTIFNELIKKKDIPKEDIQSQRKEFLRSIIKYPIFLKKDPDVVIIEEDEYEIKRVYGEWQRATRFIAKGLGYKVGRFFDYSRPSYMETPKFT